jgi:cytochrome c-type biogenesis protein CcmE
MTANPRFLIGGLLVAGAIGFLMYTGIRESSAYYLTLDEFLPRRESFAGTAVRIAGRVRPGTVAYDPRTLRLDFGLGDPARGDAGDLLAVSHVGIKPDMFGDGRDVIVEGRYASGVLRADKVLTSCPSKYEPDPDRDGDGRGPHASE